MVNAMEGVTMGASANISADPVFTDEAAGDFHLTTGSPCVDAAGSAGAPSVDFEGDPRPAGAGFDIGPDEL
ncbi:MAG TPA: choice-of-anchor Q domain-containing protein [Myxococcota bacterium]|jgi:hypothetical protein|nr:choice-of-anchor Q domain-containing protein [Myxococcota bacterium]